MNAIIHRDLKPSNVLVTMIKDRPVVKVVDFGIAKATDSSGAQQTVFLLYGGPAHRRAGVYEPGADRRPAGHQHPHRRLLAGREPIDEH